MHGPFYNAVKGTTAGTPGTGAFTPNAASASYRAWSTVPTGWWGLVRFEDGSSWELSYCYWNGTTLSRSAAQEVDSSSGSLLTLTSAATAALVNDGARVSPSLNVPVRGSFPIPGSATAPTALGLAAVTVTGTAAAAAIAATNYLTEQPRSQSADRECAGRLLTLRNLRDNLNHCRARGLEIQLPFRSNRNLADRTTALYRHDVQFLRRQHRRAERLGR
jgi:hypothetical protein